MAEDAPHPDPRCDIEFFTNEELADELAKRHDALIVSGQHFDGGYYCLRYGKPLELRGLLSLCNDAVKRSVRKWERNDHE